MVNTVHKLLNNKYYTSFNTIEIINFKISAFSFEIELLITNKNFRYFGYSITNFTTIILSKYKLVRMNNTSFFNSKHSNLKLDNMIIFRLNSTLTLRFLKYHNFVHIQKILHKRHNFKNTNFINNNSLPIIPFEVVSHHLRPKRQFQKLPTFGTLLPGGRLLFHFSSRSSLASPSTSLHFFLGQCSTSLLEMITQLLSSII